MKSIFFVTLPKSGTVYTWSTICNMTDFKMPEFHTMEGWELYATGRDFSCTQLYACGDFNTQLLRPSEMHHYMDGYFFGAHMQASYHNMTILEEAGFDRIVVLLRDPRDAFISWVHHLNNLGEKARNYHSKIYHIPRDYYHWSLEKQYDFQARSFLPAMINWVEGWLDYYASADRKIDVLFVYYDELKRNPLGYVKKILSFYDIENADYSKIPTIKQGQLHFRKGEHGQWQVELSPENQALADKLLEDRILSGFSMAIKAHSQMNPGKSHLDKGEYVLAATCLLDALKQFPNDKGCFDLFFQAIDAAGIDVKEKKMLVDAELSSPTIADCFKYRDYLLYECQQLLRRCRD